MSYEEIENKEVKARKIGLCNWCGEEINIGERYQAIACKYEGDFGRAKFHPECHKAGLKYYNSDNNGEYEPYEFKRGTTESKWN